MNNKTIAVVGHGFVGSAVEKSLVDPEYDVVIVDTKYSDGSSKDITGKMVHTTSHIHAIPEDTLLVWVCLPTPMGEDGVIDSGIVREAIDQMMEDLTATIVLKSTVTPDVINLIYAGLSYENQDRFIYQPEFLRETNAYEDYVTPEYMIFGGTCPDLIMNLLEFYDRCTSIQVPDNIQIMTAYEASFVKYAINMYLGMKVTFFNQLYDTMTKEWDGIKTQVVLKAIVSDSRIGDSHWRVPGHDGKRGFGGACFPKDISAFINTTACMSLIEKVKEINDKYREDYTLSEREEEQNVKFNGQTKEDEQIEVIFDFGQEHII